MDCSNRITHKPDQRRDDTARKKITHTDTPEELARFNDSNSFGVKIVTIRKALKEKKTGFYIPYPPLPSEPCTWDAKKTKMITNAAYTCLLGLAASEYLSRKNLKKLFPDHRLYDFEKMRFYSLFLSPKEIITDLKKYPRTEKETEDNFKNLFENLWESNLVFMKCIENRIQTLEKETSVFQKYSHLIQLGDKNYLNILTPVAKKVLKQIGSKSDDEISNLGISYGRKSQLGRSVID